VRVKMDFLHRPLPEIPLPNDLATRFDPSSPTQRRLNASMIAPTYLESRVRAKIDQLDGWGVNQPITIPFTGLIDVASLLAGHRDADYRVENDVVFLVNVTPGERHGQLERLDVGEGNYPVILEDTGGYWEHDPRGWTLSLNFDELDEDVDGDGELDLGEDLDADGVLDRPNYLPCGLDKAKDLPCDARGELASPARDDLAGRADALMTFYERETNTLILRPLVPLRERSTYAVVVTKRLTDPEGAPVGSPFDAPFHLSQREALRDVARALPAPLGADDVAFAFTFTTQSLSSEWRAARDGLYGLGPQAHLAAEFPADVRRVARLRDTSSPRFADVDNPFVMYTADWTDAFSLIASNLLGQSADSQSFKAQFDAQQYIDYHVVGSFTSPQLYSREGRAPEAQGAGEGCAARCVALRACAAEDLDYAGLGEGCEAACAALPPSYGACLARVAGCDALVTCAPPRFEGQSAAEALAPPAPDVARGAEATRDADGGWVRPCAAPERCEPDELNPARWQPLNEQSWPADLSLRRAEATPEEVWFWLMMPRADVRPAGPLNVAVLGHGYGSNRFEALAFAGYFAQRGIAVLAIDCPSHGLELSESERDLATRLTSAFGLTPFFNAATRGRSRDLNFDGRGDSGADFWTSYVFHTRDVVRQCVLDSMQLIRVFKSFDGARLWPFDLNGDGRPELAGDFDADGRVDVPPDARFSALGGSLGGITSALLASLEPSVKVAVPISGGGGLGDVGVRSLQGGVREAVILRVMGPAWLGEPRDGGTRVYSLATDLKRAGRVDLGAWPALSPLDTVVVENLTSGQRGCAYVQEGGVFRAHMESDRGDRVRLRAYRGPQLAGGEGCALRAGAPEPLATLDAFESEARFLGHTHRAGAPLVALAEGFGERRASPGMRRFLGIGQVVLDGGDPASYARHAQLEPLTYGTGERTGAHMLVVTTMGDMNVPANSGLTLGRAMGLIDYERAIPEQGGRTANQVLLETYSAEAVHRLGRHRDANGEPVHMDIELFSGGEDLWTARGVPRLRNPLRAGLDRPDRLGGASGAIFPYTLPEGQHGFNFPGGDADLYIERCRAACAPEDAACLEGCAGAHEGRFDVGYFLFGVLSRYVQSGGARWEVRPCDQTNTCED